MKQVEKNELPGKLLSRPSLEARPERVARLLLGKILIQMPKGRKPIAGRIVEVEAYLGPHSATADPAAHSHRGPTPRNQVIFGPAGHAYVYSIYGMYYCMNVTCEREGQAGCILIRALEPLTGLEEMARNRGLKIPRIFRRGGRNGRGTDEACGNLKELTGGPSRLCQALGITRSADNGLDLLDPESPLQLRDDGTKIGRVLVTRRIGIRHAVELPLRFLLAGHVCVSGPKSMNSASVFPVSSSVR